MREGITTARAGQIGEKVAVEFLEKHGFSILERNYWGDEGEIDIVAKKHRTIHFVEVKALVEKHGPSPFEPEDHVDAAKKKRLARVTVAYLGENNIPRNTSWQIDVIGVKLDLDTEKAHVRYFPNIEIR